MDDKEKPVNNIKNVPTIPLSNWTKGKELGVGESYSKVFLCHHDQLSGCQLAVKEIACSNPADSLNLEKRVEMLKDLRHDRLVQYHGTERSDNGISVFMEYVPEGSLYQHLQQYGSLEEKVCRKYTRQILQAVEYLHCKGIAHGRLKCSNVLIDAGGNVKVTDYGISKELHDINISNSEHRGCMVVNSYWHWTAPELISPQSVKLYNVDSYASDVWSIGCTVLEMLTGQPPYHDLAPFFGIYKIASEPMAVSLPSHCNSLCALSFLHDCFSRDVDSRPTVSDLFKHEFVNESATVTTSDGDWPPGQKQPEETYVLTKVPGLARYVVNHY